MVLVSKIKTQNKKVFYYVLFLYSPEKKRAEKLFNTKFPNL